MAPPESPQNRHVPLLQFIIALLLVKSKPSSLSGPDFRKQLVSHIDEGPRSHYSTQAGSHMDMISYWRNKSTGLEEENVTLKAKVLKLQARVSGLEKIEVVWKRESAELEDSARSQGVKRRRDDEPAEELGRNSAKRASTKVGAVASNEHDAVLQNFISAEAASEWDELGYNLLDNLRNLQGSSISRRGNTLGPKDLALKLSSIAIDICRHASAIDLPTNVQKVTKTALRATSARSKENVAAYNQTGPEDIVEHWLIPIGRTFPHLFVHLHTLSQFSGSGRLCGQVIHRFIDVFRVLFRRICDLAVAYTQSDQDRPETAKKQDNGRKKQHATDGRPTTSPIIMKLCKLVINMLFHLDPMSFTHKEILEGCLYLLLTRVGEVLKDFTIGDNPFGIDERDTTSRNNSHSREGRQFRVSSAASDAEASEAQAPYLIWMLNRTQRFSSSMSPAIDAITTSRNDHRQNNAARPESSRNALYDDACIRLQHTLVKAVFGEQAAASFEPALEPPHSLPDDELMTEFDTQTETTDVKDWFKNEVWRLVGWDVLRGQYGMGLTAL